MLRFKSSVDRVLALWLCGVLAALLIALVSLALINRLVYGPGGQVRAYFAAVREGDGAKALGILGAQVPDSNAAMLDGEPLRAAFKDIDHLKTVGTELLDGGQRARVTVAYSVHGEERTTDFALHKVGSHWGVFDRWAIDTSTLPTVHVEASSLSAATMNGVKVAVNGGAQDFAVAFPGVYTVDYQSALYSAVTESALVTSPDDKPTVKVSLQPSDAALASVQQQVKSYLDTCAAQHSLYPAGCPFEYDFNGRVSGNVTWLITQYPQPQVNLSDGKWSLGKSSGTAEISFTSLDLFTGETQQVTKEVTFDLTGALTTHGDELTFTPASS